MDALQKVVEGKSDSDRNDKFTIHDKVFFAQHQRGSKHFWKTAGQILARLPIAAPASRVVVAGFLPIASPDADQHLMNAYSSFRFAFGALALRYSQALPSLKVRASRSDR